MIRSKEKNSQYPVQILPAYKLNIILHTKTMYLRRKFVVKRMRSQCFKKLKKGKKQRTKKYVKKFV